MFTKYIPLAVGLVVGTIALYSIYKYNNDNNTNDNNNINNDNNNINNDNSNINNNNDNDNSNINNNNNSDNISSNNNDNINNNYNNNNDNKIMNGNNNSINQDNNNSNSNNNDLKDDNNIINNGNELKEQDNFKDDVIRPKELVITTISNPTSISSTELVLTSTTTRTTTTNSSTINNLASSQIGWYNNNGNTRRRFCTLKKIDEPDKNKMKILESNVECYPIKDREGYFFYYMVIYHGIGIKNGVMYSLEHLYSLFPHDHIFESVIKMIIKLIGDAILQDNFSESRRYPKLLEFLGNFFDHPFYEKPIFTNVVRNPLFFGDDFINEYGVFENQSQDSDLESVSDTISLSDTVSDTVSVSDLISESDTVSDSTISDSDLVSDSDSDIDPNSFLDSDSNSGTNSPQFSSIFGKSLWQ